MQAVGGTAPSSVALDRHHVALASSSVALDSNHAALAQSSVTLDCHHVARAPSRGTCITNNCIRLRLEGYLAFRRGLRPWEGSASWETCPSGIHCHYTPMMTGLTVLGTCPILINCQPLVAITPKAYNSLMTGLTFFGDLPQLDPLPAVKNCYSTAAPVAGG